MGCVHSYNCKPSLISTSSLTSCIQGGGEGHVVSIPHIKSPRDEQLTVLSLFSRGIAWVRPGQSLGTSAVWKATSYIAPCDLLGHSFKLTHPFMLSVSRLYLLYFWRCRCRWPLGATRVPPSATAVVRLAISRATFQMWGVAMAAVVAVHTAEDATQASAAEARLCYACGDVGHPSRDCVQGSKYYNCSGTVSRTRPLPSSADTNGCEQGHISKDCHSHRGRLATLVDQKVRKECFATTPS